MKPENYLSVPDSVMETIGKVAPLEEPDYTPTFNANVIASCSKIMDEALNETKIADVIHSMESFLIKFSEKGDTDTADDIHKLMTLLHKKETRGKFVSALEAKLRLFIKKGIPKKILASWATNIDSLDEAITAESLGATRQFSKAKEMAKAQNKKMYIMKDGKVGPSKMKGSEGYVTPDGDFHKEGKEVDKKGDGDAYKKFFNAQLKKFGYKNVKDIPDDKKDDFFDAIDAGWKGDNEVNEKIEFPQRGSNHKSFMVLDVPSGEGASDTVAKIIKIMKPLLTKNKGTLVSETEKRGKIEITWSFPTDEVPDDFQNKTESDATVKKYRHRVLRKGWAK